MAQFHPEQVRRIWQRVQSGPAYEAREAMPVKTDSGIYSLVSREIHGKAMLLQLSGRFSGRNREALRKMAKQEHSHAAILRGMCVLTEEKVPAIPMPKQPSLSTAALLQRCYSQTLQNLREYENRTEDRQFGDVFQKMAEQEKEHCRILLALMGSFSAL